LVKLALSGYGTLKDHQEEFYGNFPKLLNPSKRCNQQRLDPAMVAAKVPAARRPAWAVASR